MNSSRTLVALATYNEIENVPTLVEAILRELRDADVLVVDDNSPDGTGRWCDEHSAGELRLRCLHRPSKQGLGSASLAALRYAIDQGYEFVVTMDADWSHDPRHLPELLRALEHADAAIGSRYCAGGAIEGWPWRRRLLSRALNKLSGALLRVPVRDTSGAFRAYRVANLREVDPQRIHAAGYDYLEEILWRLHRAGATFAEVPITFHQRRAGQSKINFREAASKMRTLLRLALRPHDPPSSSHG
jgi:dolichol-phosphate mannosyltransferase